jgi:hypothetical protein
MNYQSHCFALPCPGGAFENSPTLQRWDRPPKGDSPEGTAEECHSIQSSLRDLEHYTLYPTLKRWAIVMHPSGMENEILVAFGFPAGRFTGLSSPVMFVGEATGKSP